MRMSEKYRNHNNNNHKHNNNNSDNFLTSRRTDGGKNPDKMTFFHESFRGIAQFVLFLQICLRVASVYPTVGH